MKAWLASLFLPFVVATLVFLPARSHAGFQFGYMPLFSNLVTAPILSWDATNLGVATGWHEVITLTNTGSAISGFIMISITGSGLDINYGGGGDNCSFSVLLPGEICTVDIINQNTGGQIWVEANDGTLSTTSRLYDCPGC